MKKTLRQCALYVLTKVHKEKYYGSISQSKTNNKFSHGSNKQLSNITEGTKQTIAHSS
jgi:hypothetical protein